MAAASPPSAPPVPRQRRRWLKRGLVALLIGGILLAVFHRPLGHRAIRWYLTGALEKAGLSGEWKTSGSLWTGLSIDDVRLTGKPESQIQSLTIRHAEVDYDLMAFRGGGPGKVLQRLVVQDLTMDIDLTRPGTSGPDKPPAARKPGLPEVILPQIRLEHVNLRLRRPDGMVEVADFNLVLDPAAPGQLEIAGLKLPGVPDLVQVKGRTRMEPQKLFLEEVALWPETGIDRLMVDLSGLPQERVGLEWLAHQGPATLELEGTVSARSDSLAVDVRLRTRSISDVTLAFWGVRTPGMTWNSGDWELNAKGPVLKPREIGAEWKLTGGWWQKGSKRIDPVELDAGLAGGRLTLRSLKAPLGINQSLLSGSAELKETWNQIGKSSGQVRVEFTAPAIDQLLPPEAQVSGLASGTGVLEFAEAAVRSASVQAAAGPLHVQGISLEKVEAAAQMAGTQVTLEKGFVQLNAGNTAGITGSFDLKEPGNFQADWQVKAEDLSTVPVQLRAETPWPSAGSLISTGSASGILAELKQRNFGSLKAQAILESQGLRLKDAALESIRVQAAAAEGFINVDQFLVRLDSANHLELSGRIDGRDTALPLEANLDLRLPEVAKLSAWSEAFGGPGIEAGQAEVQWSGQGIVKPMKMESSGRISIAGIRLAARPGVMGLQAEVVQSGSTAAVNQLDASYGPWRARGQMDWDGWHLNVPSLRTTVQDQPVAEVSARIPFHQGKIPRESPLTLQAGIRDLDLATLGKALGRPLPLSGRLSGTAALEGTIADPTGAIRAELKGLRPAKPMENRKLEPALVNLNATLKNKQFILEATAAQRPLKTLDLKASLPLDLAALMEHPDAFSNLPLRAEVNLPSSPLDFLPSWIPELRSVAGNGTAAVTVTGTVGKPVWEGRAAVKASQALFTSTALPTVKDLNLSLRFNERRVNVEQGSVMLAGGRLQVSGGADLTNAADPALDVRLNATEVLVVRDENLSLRANASVNCQGPFSKATVRGSIDLVRGRVFKEIEFLPLSLPNDLPPPPPATQLARTGAPSLPAPFNEWTFDIAIRTGDPVRLIGNVARGNAVADLKLTGKGAQPVLTGAVRLEEMWIRLPFSRLNITQGSIQFNESQPFDPQIDVTGESITGNRIVQVFVQGRALDPKVRLTSSPPLPEGEIASLLATGVTTSDLTSSGDEAAGRAAFVVLKQTYRKLFRKSALDDDDDEPPRLSFDFSVFGSDPDRRGVSAIYELNPHWRLIGRVGETGTFRGLLHYLIRFR